MTVLILGGAGYIGSILSEYLKQRGDKAIIFDNFLYEENRSKIKGEEIINGDIRNIDDLIPAIERADAVVNLAAISNDPASDLQPKLTWEVNYKANETIAALCKSTGKRIVYASSCSVYGFAESGEFNEESQLNPVTLYARTKMLSEGPYLQKDVNGIVLRFATVYGYSPKPRFDLVVNTMIGTSYFKNKIIVNGGNQWRPVVHVKDVASSIYLALHAKENKYRVYNVGSNEQNYQIATLANLVHQKLPDVTVIHNETSIDNRSYKVNFSRIAKDLGFKVNYGVVDAVDEIYTAFKIGIIKNMDEDVYYRVKYLMKYTKNGEIKKNFFIDAFNHLLLMFF